MYHEMVVHFQDMCYKIKKCHAHKIQGDELYN